MNTAPPGSEKGIGRRSATIPTTGCSNEAVSWKARVRSPIWAKFRWKLCFRVG